MTLPLPTREDLRAMSRLAVPVVAVQVGMMLLGVVDTMIVGRLSANALAAVAIGHLYFWAVSIFGWGVLFALDPIIAQAVGARDAEGVARGLQRGLMIALVLGTLLSVPLIPAVPVLHLLRQPPELIPDAARYVWLSIPGLIPFMVFLALRQTLQAMGLVRPLVIVLALANLLNAVLDWVLVFGRFGFPALGVAGSAIASTIVRVLIPAAIVAIAWPTLRSSLRPWRRETWTLVPLLRTMRLGVPLGLQSTIEYLAFAIVAIMMGWLGTTEIGAHQIAINLAALTFMVPLGVAAAGAVLVGQAIGAGDESGARRAAAAALLLGVGFMGITAIIFLSVPAQLARAYSNVEPVVALSATLIPIAGLFQVFDGTQAVAAGVLRGAGDTHVPMVINLLGYGLVGIPVSSLLAFRAGLGARGLWWGFVAGLAAVAVFLMARVIVRFGRRLHRLVIEHEPVA